MKYHIEKNTVQETLVIPLYGRKMCSELYPNLYRDETALRLIDQIDYDFSLLSKKSKSLMQQFGFLEAAMRQNDLAWEVRDYLREHPNAAVVNLGCGLDDTGRSCGNGSCRIYNLDFPGVIAVRLMLKTWIKTAEIQNVGAYFAVSDAKKELSAWSPRLRVSSRGYMLGYQSLNDPSVPGFYRFLARVGDGMMRMQIVRLEFAEGETAL